MIGSHQRNHSVGNEAARTNEESNVIEIKDKQGEADEDVEEANPFPFMKKWKPQAHKPNQLLYEESVVPMDPSLPPKSVVHRYNLLDEGQMKLTNNFNLAERLADIVWGPQKEPGDMLYPKLQPVMQTSERRRLPNPPERYFSAIGRRQESAVCRNCHVKGHIARHCTTVINMVCIYCLGHHSKLYGCESSYEKPLHIEVM